MSSVDAVHVDGTAVLLLKVEVGTADLDTRFDWCTTACWYTRVAQDKLVGMNELVLVAPDTWNLDVLDSLGLAALDMLIARSTRSDLDGQVDRCT